MLRPIGLPVRAYQVLFFKRVGDDDHFLFAFDHPFAGAARLLPLPLRIGGLSDLRIEHQDGRQGRFIRKEMQG